MAKLDGLRSRPRGHGWYEDFGRRRLVAQRSMRPNGLVMASPALDDDLRLCEGVESFPVEKFVPEPGVERLDKAILPWAAWRNVSCLRSELAPVIWTSPRGF